MSKRTWLSLRKTSGDQVNRGQGGEDKRVGDQGSIELRGNLRGTSGDQGKDHVRPRKRPKLEEALKPSPVAVAIGGGVMSWRPSGEQAGVGWLEVDEWRPS